MQRQKTQSTRSKSKSSWKRIVILVPSALSKFSWQNIVIPVSSVLSKFGWKHVVVLPILLAAIVTGILGIWSGTLAPATPVGACFLFITVVGGLIITLVLALSRTQSTSSPAPTSISNAQSGRGVQNTGASLISVKLTATQSVSLHSAGAKAGQTIFHFNMPLHDPKDFYGHNAARTTLITRTANGGSSSIVGARRAGKTWLLDYLQLFAPTHSKLGSAYHIGSVSATHPQSGTLAKFVQWALEELAVPISAYDPSLQPLDQFSRGVRALKKQDIIPVLCIDEFEGFDNRQEFSVKFIEGLRAMTQSDGLVLVTASRHPLKKLIEDLTGETSPLFNIVQQISLHPFTEQEAHEFVNDKSNIAGFTKTESEFFFDQSTLHNTNGERYWPPLRLQLVGQILLDDKQETLGQVLDNQLGNFRYRNSFEKRLDEKYQTIV